MANPPRTRKRVHAFRRASDGSAFQNCNECGVSVAIALFDMHECEPMKNNVRRFKGGNHKQYVTKQSFIDQPRSPFRLFMESFMKTCKNQNSIEVDRKGLETWKNMSKEERNFYVIEAEKLNSAYETALLKEVDEMLEMDDEADSAMVGKFDQYYEKYHNNNGDSDNSNSFESSTFYTYDSTGDSYSDSYDSSNLNTYEQ